MSLRSAKHASKLAVARIQGMKLRAEIDPPRPAQGGFPYPHKTCAEWEICPDFVTFGAEGGRRTALLRSFMRMAAE